jgi:uncharacterized protein YjiS (DUF1127 family)
MTYTTDTPIAVEVVTPARYLRWIREDLSQRLARYRLYRRTLAELSVLSDRDCDDLGLDRYSLREVARQTAYGA